ISTISYDADLAYAILLTNDQETALEPYDGTMIRYTPPSHDYGVFKLMKTMASTGSEKVVRVLRSWRLNSTWRPRAGIRYDGLYRILSYSVRLIPPNKWCYSFVLEREINQVPLSCVLNVPSVEQMDDWIEYLALAERGGGDKVECVGMEGKDGEIEGEEKQEQEMEEKKKQVEEEEEKKKKEKKENEADWRDSGYFSIKPWASST
ncbi:MAG: hypothetical protein Q9164_005741, partial [Protoblastenia rupestris]